MVQIIKASGHGGQTRGLTAGATSIGDGGGGAMPGTGVGRFDRMFPDATDRPEHPDPVLLALAELMVGTGDRKDTAIDDGKPIRPIPDPEKPGETLQPNDPGDDNVFIPAGYTYFGQFIDHDITFDPTPLHAKEIDPEALQDYRTPAFDLDSVYGTGPDNQPYLYIKDAHNLARLRVGAALDPAKQAGAVGARHDHFRLPPGPDGLSVAVLGDKRNDENKIVAQMHAAFVALHNKLIGDPQALLKMGSFDIADPDACFRMAVKVTRWHYQWVVLFDYLNRICQPGMVDEVLNPGSSPRLHHYLRGNPQFAYMPVEFAVAAFRIGHSMVRPTYALNVDVGTKDIDAQHLFAAKRIPIFKVPAGPTEALNGFGQAIPQDWGIDWSFFLPGPPKPADDNGTPLSIPQPSYRIDATIVDPLRKLPEFDGVLPDANLAYRNLLRSKVLKLPSGEAVADKLGLVAIPFKDLWWAGSKLDHAKVDPDRKTLANRRKAFGDAHKAQIEHKTPLWYYILREAELYGTMHDATDPFGGQHLGPVGSRIVAETFIGLLWKDKTSILHSQPTFRPFLGLAGPLAQGAKFGLADLLRYALT